MKRKPISMLSVDELSRQKKMLSGITLAAGVLMCLLAGYILYQVFQAQQYYMALLLFSCIGTLIPGFIGIKEINQELRKRQMS